ncbi:serine hydrolase domain-containing protein [Caulobacter sp. NIBR2454]|uniref:serine hydrolase domain-containing protein n=1 Tax=Caulobacter sp. NIBR2454 TaxID=3015996 RepID=UPI0022B6082B|nr:serine hydrolase [Caulobacter sp. NIBR2454]
MGSPLSRRDMLATAMAAAAAPALAAEPMQAVADYAASQNTTGFLIVQNGRALIERNWPAASGASAFQAYVHGKTASGALLEDVASQQKSFVAMLAAIAVDRGLLDVNAPVSDLIGAGWSRASPEQEKAIQVIHLLTMNSGLGETLDYQAPPGSTFLYNTPAYAVTKRVLAAIARQPLEAITTEWMTGPAGMVDTAWRARPASFGDVGNPTGLVTCPRDIAKLGQIILDGGLGASGARIVSKAGLQAMFSRTATNPSYGRLWWLNGGDHAVRAPARRTEGPLVPAAPADLVAALGFLDRKLYIAPSLKLVVVRTGPAAADKDFDQQLWLRLSRALA